MLTDWWRGKAVSKGSSAVFCRLCQGALSQWMRARVLGKYDVCYWCCDTCGSLQTDPPYWLDEAYGARGVGDDTGACQRSLDLTLQTAALLSLLRWSAPNPCLDFGAGMGLFARMMRDRGYNFLAYDKYVFPYFMDWFVVNDPMETAAHLVTAYEVIEHMPNPISDLNPIFGRNADVVIVTTELCDGVGKDWWYLNPPQGQHVFFYSRKALALIGEGYGYCYNAVSNLHVFTRPDLDVEGALNIARDPKRFGQMMLEHFLRHQSNPYRFATVDSRGLD
jgi:hypothetical protein